MRRFLCLAVSVFGAASVTAAEPLFETVRVFPIAPQNKPNYRIPGILQAPNGDLLVFAEKRNDGIGDIGNHDIASSPLAFGVREKNSERAGSHARSTPARASPLSPPRP